MLLLSQQLNNQTISYFDSSNILACSYMPSDKKLLIIFKNGSRYMYYDIPNSIYESFVTSDSQGKALNKLIKTQGFEYEFYDTTDTEEILNIIEEAKKSS